MERRLFRATAGVHDQSVPKLHTDGHAECGGRGNHGFKEINDSLGHEAGDRLLIDVAERLTDCVREDNTVARLGGDEFTVILTSTRTEKDVELVGQKIIDAVVLPFQFSDQPIHVSISIGIALYPRDGFSRLAPPAGKVTFSSNPGTT
ncbi:GGDEF domain-containing protein [Wenzhouxiangella sp. XN201]|uniref:diguanylate cyclase domain-containing protein n=1 Tax=Wenzhouxiangella sp. XN201 TaxID=2710755 RepID=UPI00196A0706